MKVTLEVELDVTVEESEIAELAKGYTPTEAVPEPDDEWLHAEKAMNALDAAWETGYSEKLGVTLGDITVTDVQSGVTIVTEDEGAGDCSVCGKNIEGHVPHE